MEDFRRLTFDSGRLLSLEDMLMFREKILILPFSELYSTKMEEGLIEGCECIQLDKFVSQKNYTNFICQKTSF